MALVLGRSEIFSATYLAFLATALVIELTPGPNMAYLAVLSSSRGRRAGYAATIGVGLGLAIVGLAAAFGLAAAISNSKLLYEAMRWAGVAYMLWLAWEGWHEAEVSPDTADGDNDEEFFRRGLVTNLLNPKAAVFFVAILPTFIEAARPVLAQTLLLSATYVAVATLVHGAIVTLAGAAQHLLRDPGIRMVVGRALSLALAAIALWFAVATAR